MRCGAGWRVSRTLPISVCTPLMALEKRRRERSRRKAAGSTPTAGLMTSEAIHQVKSMFQPPWVGGSFLARRATTVDQQAELARQLGADNVFSDGAALKAAGGAYVNMHTSSSHAAVVSAAASRQIAT